MHSARVHSWMGGREDLDLTSCLDLCFDCCCLCDWTAVAVDDEDEKEGLPREGDVSSSLDYDSEIDKLPLSGVYSLLAHLFFFLMNH